jgi:hypothetical protein
VEGARAEPPPRPRRRTTLIVAATGVALLVAAAIVAAVELGGGGTPAPVVVPPNSVALVDAHRNRVDSFVGVGRGPVSIAVDRNGVWVSNADDGTVDQLDPLTGRLMHTIGIGGDVFTVAVGFGSVWVAGGNDGTVVQIDPVRGQVQRTIQLANPLSVAPSSVFFVATDNRYVWATQGAKLLRIDPTTDQVDGRVVVGAATAIATGSGSVWVTTLSERLLRVDARSVKVTASSTLSSAAIAATFGGGGLWLAYGAGSNVDLVDPVSLGITTVGTSVAEPEIVAFGKGSLWVGNRNGVLERIDVSRQEPIATLHVGPGLSALTTDGDKVWAAVRPATRASQAP